VLARLTARTDRRRNDRRHVADVLTIEPDGEATHGVCPDCGELTAQRWATSRSERSACGVLRSMDGRASRTWRAGHGEHRLLGDGSLPASRLAFDLSAAGHEWPRLRCGRCHRVYPGERRVSRHETHASSSARRSAEAGGLQIVDRLIEDDPRFRTFIEGGVQQ